MSTHLAPRHWSYASHLGAFEKALLACGVLYPLAYVFANDMIAAVIYDGYSRIDQAISELSATEAPSKGFLTALLPIFSLLVLGFGIGVSKAAGQSRALRVTGAILIAQGILFPVWLLFPMTSREQMVEGTGGGNDVGHLVLGALAVLFIMAEIGFSAAAFGRRFRLFALAMAATTLVCGALTGVMSADIASGDPTPWMGFVERLSYGSWLLWMAVLAILLLRGRSDAPEARVPARPADLVEAA